MSLRTRILGGMGLIAVVLVMVTVAITRIAEANLVDQVDTQLKEALGPIRRASGGFGPAGPPSPGEDRDLQGQLPIGGAQQGTGPESDPLSSLYVGTVTDGKVETVLSPNLRGANVALPSPDVQQVLAASRTGEPFTVDGEGTGPRYRMLSYVDDRSGSVMVIGSPLDSVDATIANLMAIEAIGVGVILVLLGVLAWWVIHLGVRPIKSMTTTATAIAGGDLSQRVPDAAPGTEAGELGEALNDMLARIEMSFDERTRVEAQLRQFVADASHELRTPVATIRGYAELYRAGGLASPDALDDAMSRTEAESVRMGTLVDDLLSLARLDQGRPLHLEAVDLANLADDAAADARVLAPGRAVTADTDGPVGVTGDEVRLRQVITNLVGNALVHTPDDTSVEIAAYNDGATAVLSVTDHGPGMDEATASHAFERFYRADPARSRHRGGSGLGLAIVAAIVEAHGGTVELDTAPGIGTTVSVHLPVSDNQG